MGQLHICTYLVILSVFSPERCPREDQQRNGDFTRVLGQDYVQNTYRYQNISGEKTQTDCYLLQRQRVFVSPYKKLLIKIRYIIL